MSGHEIRWNPATRFAFRFVFSYFVLYTAASHGFRQFPLGVALAERYFEFWDAVVVWAHETVFQIPGEIEFQAPGVNNSVYGMVLFLCYLGLAGAAAAAWPVLDRRRLHYSRLHQGLRLLLRFLLGVSMIHYGALKLIPSQMVAPPPLGVLQQRIGDISPNLVLWWSIGSSPPFESFLGLVELVGGVLLLVPRTALLGALVSAGSMAVVFLLNMCYDVPVKLPSLHLLVMSLVLVAPDLRRLADVFLFNRRVEPVRKPPLFASRSLEGASHVLLFLLGLYAAVLGFEGAAERYRSSHPPRPPFYGLWTVEEPAADPNRWRAVMIAAPGSLRAELMNGAWKSHPLSAFSVEQPEKHVLILKGTLDGQPVRTRLRKAPLTRGDFDWISDR